MFLDFYALSFEIADGEIWLRRCGSRENIYSRFAQVQVAGENKNTHMGAKMVNSSEVLRLRYCSHSVNKNMLIICQRSELVEIESRFTGYEDTNAVRMRKFSGMNRS